MESDNVGDWNSYSKYALGWITPIIIDSKEDKYEITIGAYSTKGDAIVVRTLGYEAYNTAFDEYIIIDLFADDGLYKGHSSFYGLNDVVGVRIYHINSIYEQRSYEKADKTTGIIATPHYTPSISSKFAYQGKFLIEMIQNGNANTFTTGGRNVINNTDLFYENDIFTVESYDNFFYNGLMDNSMKFGYSIKIKTIVSDGKNSTATIIIEKN